MADALDRSAGAEEPQPIERPSVELIAAALRADAADVDTFVVVLSSTLSDTLPAGMVEVEHERSLADRLSGRPATPVAVTVTTPEAWLRLSRGRRGGTVRAEINRIVRGVVISRREVTVDEWVNALAEILTDLAARNGAAREALARLLGG